MAVIANLIEGGNITVGSNGITDTQKYLVDNITGAAAARAYAAINAPGIPQKGTPHPAIDGLFALDITGTAVTSSNSQFFVTVVYREPTQEEAITSGAVEFSEATISVNASVSEEETFLDVNGDPMTWAFDGYFNNLIFNVNTNETYTESSRVTAAGWRSANVKRPRLSVSFKRKEAKYPAYALDNFLGKMNSTAWNGKAANTWLCIAITVEKNGDIYDVNYSFVYAEETWNFIYLISYGSLLPLGQPTEGNGKYTFQVYQAANFNQLSGLDLK